MEGHTPPNGQRRSSIDAVVEVYARDVDMTLVRRNLTLTHEQRLEQLMSLQRFAVELRRAGSAARGNH